MGNRKRKLLKNYNAKRKIYLIGNLINKFYKNDKYCCFDTNCSIPSKWPSIKEKKSRHNMFLRLTNLNFLLQIFSKNSIQ